MKVKDFMITDVIKVHPETSLRELLKRLVDRKVGGVPVVNEQNQLVGMVSDGDVLRYVRPTSAQHYNFFAFYVRVDEVRVEEKISTLLERPVTECMKKSKLVTLSAEDDFDVVVDVLSKHHFKKIPVLDTDRHVIGVISRGDVIRYMVKKWIE